MADVFISYAREDREFVRQLDAELKTRKQETWVDWEDIPPTAEWLKEISVGIAEAQAFVFVISPDSVVSDVCQYELTYAVSLKKRLIPVVRREVDAAAIPHRLTTLNWIFFRETDEFSAAFALLIEAIETDLDWVRAHTHWLRRALDWESRQHDVSLLLRGNDLKEAQQWLLQAEAHKDPRPTPLHTQYVIASRQDETRRGRRKLWGTLAVLLVVTVSGFIAWEQNEEERQQRHLALVRRLTTQAELVRNWRTDLLESSILLAAEAAQPASFLSWRTRFFSPPSNLEAIQSLRQGLALLPSPTTIEHPKGVSALAFSSRGRYLATAGYDGVGYLWEGATKKQLTRLPHFERTQRTNVGLKSLTVSPDEQYVITVGYDGTACVWEIPDGPSQCLSAIVGITAIAFNPVNKSVATAHYDGTVRLWRANGRQDAWLTNGQPAHEKNVGFTGLAFSPNGQYLAASSYDGATYVWRVSSRQQIRRLAPSAQDGEPTGATAVAFSPNGLYLATASYDGRVSVWETTTNRQITFLPHPQGVTALAFSPDSRLLATVSYDPIVRVWESLSGQEVTRFYHESGATAVAFSPVGELALATGSYDPFARVWRVTNTAVVTHLFHEADVRTIAFSPDGRYLATASFASTVPLRERSTNRIIAHLQHRQGVTAALFSPDGQYLATASYDHTACLWEAPTGHQVACVSHTADVTAAAISHDSRFLATGDNDGAACLWEIPTGQPIRCFLHPLRLTILVFSPNGQYLLTADAKGTARLWEVATGDELPCPFTNVSALAFSPDGQYIAAGGYDGAVCVWEESITPNPLCFSHTTGGVAEAGITSEPMVTTVTFSPTGRYLATGGWDYATRLWEPPHGATTTWRSVARLQHDSGVTAVAFSPDETLVATASYDHTARIWKTPTGEEVANFLHRKEVMAVAFSPDGKLLATGSRDYAAQIGYFLLEDLRREACQRLSRNLTLEEWRMYVPDEPYRKTCPHLPSSEEQHVGA